MIKQVLAAACLVLPLVASAADEKKPTAQQQRMAQCNKDAAAGNLKGDARKEFMADCLGGGKVAAASKSMTQQQRMSSCNREAAAKKLQGDPRKKFMAECLRG